MVIFIELKISPQTKDNCEKGTYPLLIYMEEEELLFLIRKTSEGKLLSSFHGTRSDWSDRCLWEKMDTEHVAQSLSLFLFLLWLDCSTHISSSTFGSLSLWRRLAVIQHAIRWINVIQRGNWVHNEAMFSNQPYKADAFEPRQPDSCVYFLVGLEFGKAEKGIISYHPINPQHVNFLFGKLWEAGMRTDTWGAKIAHGDQVSGAVGALGSKVIVGQVGFWPGQFVTATVVWHDFKWQGPEYKGLWGRPWPNPCEHSFDLSRWQGQGWGDWKKIFLSQERLTLKRAEL